MNTEDLDRFFAEAEDVLEHWSPGTDAMIARVPADGADDRLAPRGDSYYAQLQPFTTRDAQLISECLTGLVLSVNEALKRFSVLIAEMVNAFAAVPQAMETSEAESRQRVLEYRRSRGHGPGPERRLDGRRARSGVSRSG